jgi:hypothetical protein
MFCSIEDAWGGSYLDYKPEMVENNKPEKFENIEYKFKNDIEKNNIEKINIEKNNNSEYNKYIELKEKFEDVEKTEICIAVDNHIQNCPYCKQKYKGNNLNIDSYIMNNKESINIFLIGLLIICFFHFFRNF